MSSIFTYDLEIFGEALAASPAFQAWCGASDEEEAAACIEWFGSSRSTTLPVAILSHGNGWKRELDTMDGTYTTSPQLVVEFVDGCDFDDSNRTVFSALLDAVGAIVGDIEQAGFTIHTVAEDSENTPARAPEGAESDWASFALIVDCEFWEVVET